jgi:hypothetical protein
LAEGAKMIRTEEDDEFERIEREIKWRQMLIDHPPIAIPFISQEEWKALNADEDLP